MSKSASKISWSEHDIATQLRKIRLAGIEQSASDHMPADSESDSNTFTDQLGDLIAILESQLDNPVPLSFSAVSDKKYKIKRKGILYFHPAATLHKTITASRALGSDTLWSDDNMYKHLSFLANSFTNETEYSFPMVIDTFFFRSTAMVLPQKVIVRQQKPNQTISTIQSRLSQVDTVSGVFDYTAIVVDPYIAACYIRFPPAPNRYQRSEASVFCVVKAKADSDFLHPEDHISEVVLELVACAKYLGKSHIRGALTTGFQWYFIAVDIDADNDGAQYWVSDLIEWRWRTNEDSPLSEYHVKVTTDHWQYDPALIAGILSSWIPESFVEFNGDQWFVQQPGDGGTTSEKTS